MNNYLYKYKPINKNSLEIIINKELYFPKSVQFNDPFDGQLLPSNFINEVKELEYIGVDVDNEITKHESFIKDRINGYGILSLSNTCRDILMWSHYSDSHKGICFGFKYNLQSYLENIGWPIDHKIVRYSRDHPFKEIHDDLVLGKRFNSNDCFLNVCNIAQALEEATFTIKHSSWSYEKEERLISQVAGPHSFNAEALDRVVLGMNISKRDEAIIKSLLDRNEWRHVRIFKATRGQAALSIDIHEEKVHS